MKSLDFKKFSSLKEAELDEAQEYANLSGSERVQVLLDLVSQFGVTYYGPSERFERVFKVIKFK